MTDACARARITVKESQSGFDLSSDSDGVETETTDSDDQLAVQRYKRGLRLTKILARFSGG